MSEATRDMTADSEALDVLVLGGTRFVGRRLVRLLHGRGHNVTVLNRGLTEAELPPEVNRIRADRSRPDEIKSALQGRDYDAVFDISGYRPAELRPTVEALHGRVASYVFCSSVAAYASSDRAPIREDFPLNRGPEADDYGRDKVLCEDLLMERSAKDGFPVTIIRPPYVYGPHDHSELRLPGVFARLGRRRRIIVPGAGLTMAHPVHVDDLASAFAAVPGRTEATGQAYNATATEAMTVNGYLKTIASVMGVEAEVVHVEASAYGAMLDALGTDHGGRLLDYTWAGTAVYSNEKLRRELGWSPRYDLRTGIEMTYRWWLKQGWDERPRDYSSDERAWEWLGSQGLV